MIGECRVGARVWLAQGTRPSPISIRSRVEGRPDQLTECTNAAALIKHHPTAEACAVSRFRRLLKKGTFREEKSRKECRDGHAVDDH
eukprot:scaffold1954_cov268-Pinguiococcus_pyrenoidosus.AAC.196